MSSYLTVLAVLTAMYLNVIFAMKGNDHDTAHVVQGLTQQLLNCEAQLQQCQSQCASPTAAPTNQGLASEFRAVIDNADRVHDDHPFVVYCESVKETFKDATFPFPFFQESNSNCHTKQEKYKGDICAFVNQEFQNSPRPSDMKRDVCEESGAKLHFDNKHGAGSVDFTRLPQSLEELSLSENEFSGTVDLTQLPQSLGKLYLGYNRFSGSIDLTKLPHKMHSLLLHNNAFVGDLDFTQLPQSLKTLFLNENKFSGTVDLTQLPHGMRYLWLHENDFVGDLSLTQLPPLMTNVNFCGNKFSNIHPKGDARIVNECQWHQPLK